MRPRLLASSDLKKGISYYDKNGLGLTPSLVAYQVFVNYLSIPFVFVLVREYDVLIHSRDATTSGIERRRGEPCKEVDVSVLRRSVERRCQCAPLIRYAIIIECA